MLGQPMSMLIPQVLGFKLVGELHEGATATDLVLTVTERLRERGVVGKFVEFYGAGLAGLPIADRATIGNMSPEFGSTCAIFPIDAETLRYLEFSGRPKERLELVEAYAKEQGLWHDEHSEEPTFSDQIELDLADVVPSIAGPKRPQDRVSLTEAKAAFRMALDGMLPEDDSEDDSLAESFPASDPVSTHVLNGDGHEPSSGTGGTQVAERTQAIVPVTLADGTETELDHGHVVIAAITSCTNTSNPSVMIGAGILARNAVHKGLRVKPWVKTSLAPGSKVVSEYLDRAGLTEYLDELGFNLVGYGCTTCIGNSGPLPERDLGRRRRRGPGGRVSAVRQPQLRGPDQPRREDELPRLAAAVRRLRPRRDDGHRPLRRATRRGRARRACVSEGHLARLDRGRADDRGGRPVGHVPQELQRGVRRRRPLELARGPERRELCVGRGVDLRPQADVLRRPPHAARAADGHRGRARAGGARRQRHHRPHLPSGLDQEGQPGRQVPDRARGRAQGLQLLRLAARQPRGDDARHVRQHPAAQPARAGYRGRCHAVPRRRLARTR